MVITASSSHIFTKLIRSLGQTFPVKGLGKLSYVLDLEFDYLNTSLFITQWKYILDLLKKSKMTIANPISSPMSASDKLSKFNSPSFLDLTLFRSIIGSLQYISLTRPDISFSINKVCQFMHDPKGSYWTVVKRVLRYLKSTINHGIFFSNNSNFSIHAYADADWAGYPNDRQSTRSFIFSWIITWFLEALASNILLLALVLKLSTNFLSIPLLK